MRNRICALLLAGLLLGLCGCSLARPEGEGGDRWLGYYVALSDEAHPINGVEQEGWVDYGSQKLQTEYGSLTVFDRVLPAQEENGRYTFPGLEGFALFYVETVDENGNHSSTVRSDMSDGQFHVTETDEGTQVELAGTVYYGLPEGETDWEQWYEGTDRWHLSLCEVYQMADGTVYLTGSGHGVGPGGGMTFTEKREYTQTEGNAAVTDSLEVAVTFTEISRLTALTVRQYGADGVLIQSDELPVDGSVLTAKWASGAAWAAVEEIRGSVVERTVYDRPDPEKGPVGHETILLDANGLGRAVSIELK